MLHNEDQHEYYLIQGLKYLDKNLPGANKKLVQFSDRICSRLLERLGKNKILKEFSLPDYKDEEFVFLLAFSLDFGVPVFIIKNDLYLKIVNTDDLLPVVTAVNFCIAENIATVFTRMGLRNSKNTCVYANSGLMQLVNRSMGRFKELPKAGFDNFKDFFE